MRCILRRNALILNVLLSVRRQTNIFAIESFSFCIWYVPPAQQSTKYKNEEKKSEFRAESATGWRAKSAIPFAMLFLLFFFFSFCLYRFECWLHFNAFSSPCDTHRCLHFSDILGILSTRSETRCAFSVENVDYYKLIIRNLFIPTIVATIFFFPKSTNKNRT